VLYGFQFELPDVMWIPAEFDNIIVG